MTTTQNTHTQWLEAEKQLTDLMQKNGITTGITDTRTVSGMTGLELFQSMLRGERPRAPISECLDFMLVEAEFGRAVFQGRPSPKFYNPMGTVHGGWYCTLLDSAVGCAVHTTLPQGRAYTTLEIKVNMVRGLTDKVPLLRAEGKVLHAGRQSATAEGKLYDADGKLYAHASTTCLIFDMPVSR